MSNFAYNEQAQGLVNGSNKVFTVAHTIVNIESLRIGYMEYSNFTFVGKTITLVDAPLTIYGGVFVDYEYTASSTPTIPDPNNFIYDEKLIGSVDGVNKVFHSVYPVYQIDELRINGIAYTLFGVNGRTITLNDAPTVALGNPRMDYYRDDVTLPVIDSTITLSQLRSSIYTRLGHTITSLQYPKELADEYISEGIIRISKMKKDRRKRGIFAFKKASDTYASSEGQNSITIGFNSSYLPSKGIAILGKGDLLYYNGKGTNSITTLNGLEIDQIENEKIQFGYKLSKNVDKVSEVTIDGFKLTPADFNEYRNYKDGADKYCVYNGYLFLPYSIRDGQVVSVVYYAKSTSTYLDNDIIDFDGDYIPVIKSFVLWNMYKDREDDRKIDEERSYRELLREYKRELSRQYENTSAVFQTASPLNKWSQGVY